MDLPGAAAALPVSGQKDAGKDHLKNKPAPGLAKSTGGSPSIFVSGKLKEDGCRACWGGRQGPPCASGVISGGQCWGVWHPRPPGLSRYFSFSLSLCSSPLVWPKGGLADENVLFDLRDLIGGAPWSLVLEGEEDCRGRIADPRQGQVGGLLRPPPQGQELRGGDERAPVCP